MTALRKPAPSDRSPSDRSPSPELPPADAQRVERVTPPPFKWQFGLSALFGTMLLLCLPFAIWGAILRADPDEQVAVTLLCIAAPLGVLVLAATTLSISRAVRKLRHKRTDKS